MAVAVAVAVGEVTVMRVLGEAILIVMERNIPVGEYLVFVSLADRLGWVRRG